MRLGGYYGANSLNELEMVCPLLDEHGLSAIGAPEAYWTWPDDQCVRFGQAARQLGLRIGEAGYWENLLDPDPEAVAHRVAHIRLMLRKADLMQAGCVVTLVGSFDARAGALSPHPLNFGQEAQQRFREICLRIVDGLDLRHTRYAIEPWNNTFFQEPEAIHAFLDDLADRRVALHLDQMNMVTPSTYFHTTSLINRTFDLLASHVASIHAKDILWAPGYFFLKLDEVPVGDGVMDYDTFLRRIDADLDPDVTVFTEHFPTEADYVAAIERLHAAARRVGLRFRRREPRQNDLELR